MMRYLHRPNLREAKGHQSETVGRSGKTFDDQVCRTTNGANVSTGDGGIHSEERQPGLVAAETHPQLMAHEP
jgi:hypothetical protein